MILTIRSERGEPAKIWDNGLSIAWLHVGMLPAFVVASADWAQSVDTKLEIWVAGAGERCLLCWLTLEHKLVAFNIILLILGCL